MERYTIYIDKPCYDRKTGLQDIQLMTYSFLGEWLLERQQVSIEIAIGATVVMFLSVAWLLDKQIGVYLFDEDAYGDVYIGEWLVYPDWQAFYHSKETPKEVRDRIAQIRVP